MHLSVPIYLFSCTCNLHNIKFPTAGKVKLSPDPKYHAGSFEISLLFGAWFLELGICSFGRRSVPSGAPIQQSNRIASSPAGFSQRHDWEPLAAWGDYFAVNAFH